MPDDISFKNSADIDQNLVDLSSSLINITIPTDLHQISKEPTAIPFMPFGLNGSALSYDLVVRSAGHYFALSQKPPSSALIALTNPREERSLKPSHLAYTHFTCAPLMEPGPQGGSFRHSSLQRRRRRR